MQRVPRAAHVEHLAPAAAAGCRRARTASGAAAAATSPAAASRSRRAKAPRRAPRSRSSATCRRVVARVALVLVGRVVLLVDHDQPEVADRREDGGARADRDPRLAACAAAATRRSARPRRARSAAARRCRRSARWKRPTVCGVSAISGTSTITPSPALERRGRRAQVDLGLARAGDAVEQPARRPRATAATAARLLRRSARPRASARATVSGDRRRLRAARSRTSPRASSRRSAADRRPAARGSAASSARWFAGQPLAVERRRRPRRPTARSAAARAAAARARAPAPASSSTRPPSTARARPAPRGTESSRTARRRDEPLGRHLGRVRQPDHDAVERLAPERDPHDRADVDRRVGQRVVERPGEPAGRGERLDAGDHGRMTLAAAAAHKEDRRRAVLPPRPVRSRAWTGSCSATTCRCCAPSPTASRRRSPTSTRRSTRAARRRAARSPPSPTPSGDRTGFGGRRYASRGCSSESSYRDAFDDYLGFLEPRLREVRRLLAPEGTLYFHIDYREAHYCKLLLDELFGRECFLNELIWAYDYGAKPRNRWPAKHDTILVYVKDPERYLFDADAVDREPYMAPGPRHARAARARQAPDRRLVAHDRLPHRPREDRLPDAEAGGDRAPHGAGLVAPGRPVPRPVRRLGHARRRRGRSSAAATC